VALAAALALHAGALWCLRAKLRESSPSFRAAPAGPAANEWEIELSGAAEAEAVGAVSPDNPRASEPSGRAEARSAPRANTRRSEHPSAEAEISVPAPSAPEPEAEPSAPAAKAIDLGLGADGWQRWAALPTEGAAAQKPIPAARTNGYQVFRAPPASTTGGLQEGLEAHDRALGLGPEGRVLSALQHAAHEGLAPEVGVARFEVTVHRSGVVEVTLGAASRDGEQWRNVAADVARNLRAAPPRIAPPREGFKLVVELAADWTLPNGTKPSELTRPHLHAPPLKLQRTADAVDQTQRENPTTKNPDPDSIAIKLDSPGIYVSGHNGVCNYNVGVGAISPGYRLGAAAGPVAQGTCDPSNIGAKPQRVVRTRVIALSQF